MKKLLLFLVTLTTFFQATSQNVVTYFNGQSKIQADGKIASLYSVELSDQYTFVTIELSPTYDRNRMTYFTSGFTHIQVGPYYKIRFLGALSNDGNSYHSCEPDDGWGWSNCKKGENIMDFELLKKRREKYIFSRVTEPQPRISTRL